MKFWLKFLLVVIALGAAGTAAVKPAYDRWQEQNAPKWRTAKVTRGRIIADVRATGKIEPVLSVSIGSFVSGPITEMHADFNTVVKKDDLLVRIDPRLYQANVDQGKAQLATREADVERVKALLQQAKRNEQRAIALREENEDFISGREMDSFHFEVKSLEAQLKLAEAAVLQAKASLENAEANLGYTEIRSPVDGVVIDCKITRGQTLAAQFQTPELFIIAPDMEKKMHVLASIDEADIGLIREAKEKSLPVEFTVDAYPDDVFEGEIEQVRQNATAVENVVTYPVVVGAPNPDLKLLPGLTASISFQVDERRDVIRIPNAAIRFYPPSEQHVHPDDRKILTGEDDEESADFPDNHLTEDERAELRKKRSQRHVWKVDGQFLRAVQVEVGLNDLRFTEMVAGEIEKGDELVIGLE